MWWLARRTLDRRVGTLSVRGRPGVVSLDKHLEHHIRSLAMCLMGTSDKLG